MRHNMTPAVNSQYGAPMGRRSRVTLDFSRKLYLRRVSINSGGYDAGGAYWGIGAPLWCAMDSDGDCYYFRAPSRDKAKAHIRAELDDSARFFK